MESDQSNHKNDVLLELNFVPTWARRPPGVNPYLQGGADQVSGGQRGRDFSPRHAPRRSDRPGGGRRERDRRERPGSRAIHEKRDFSASASSRPHREPQPRPEADLPVDIHFIPEKKRLGAVVRLIRDTGRAYPLMDLAGLFLANPENYLIKMEFRKESSGEPKNRFYQCSLCKAVYLDTDHLQSHLLQDHEDELFDTEEVELEAPNGHFVCVGRCGLSGVLVGPPNHHAFEETVRALHRARFSHMAYGDYRARIEMLHDAELIEQWKVSVRKQKRYRLKGEEGEINLTLAQAHQQFIQTKADRYFSGTMRVMIPAGSARTFGDQAVTQTMRRAWNRESKHPFTLAIALRPAFKHMGLHLFKVGEGMTFVTSVKPHPVSTAHMIDSIREVIEYLQAHPGCTRQQLVEGLCGEAGSNPEHVANVLNPLRWLVERGHVIEFFNGTLSVASSGSKA
ncbi:MAG: hypothetical protein PHG65_05015 [Kiritimatiellae bacterium]|nr:hypothetical protein [Kiritimatiellia bacterium]